MRQWLSSLHRGEEPLIAASRGLACYAAREDLPGKEKARNGAVASKPDEQDPGGYRQDTGGRLADSLVEHWRMSRRRMGGTAIVSLVRDASSTVCGSGCKKHRKSGKSPENPAGDDSKAGAVREAWPVIPRSDGRTAARWRRCIIRKTHYLNVCQHSQLCGDATSKF